MEIIKHKNNAGILQVIKHNIRAYESETSYGNQSIDLSQSWKNYSLIDRPDSASEINKGRKEFLDSIFKYNRSNLVYGCELVIQAPEDCPEEQHDLFFHTVLEWYVSNYLPAGLDSVYLAEVHRDEHHLVMTKDGEKDLSHDHMHIMFTPAIEAGEKHPDYEWRLSADALTKRAVLKVMHQSLQATINDTPGLTATVVTKKEGEGKSIALSTAQLKEITEKTGEVIDKTWTADDLAQLINHNIELAATVKELELKLENVQEHIPAQEKNLSWGPTAEWGKTSVWGEQITDIEEEK